MVRKTTIWGLLLLIATTTLYAQKENKVRSSVKTENFKYLFSEALKKKIFGDYGSAVKYFMECEKIQEDDAVEYQLSQLFAMAGDQKHAIEFGRKALEKDPGNIWYYYQLANIYRMFGMSDSLLMVYDRIVERFPELLKDKMTYADLLVATGQAEKALNIYRDIEKETGESSTLEVKIANALMILGKEKEALSVIEKAMGHFGQEKELMLAYAQILERNEQKKKAEIIYAGLLKKYPEDPNVKLKVYEHYFREKKFVLALNLLSDIVEDPAIDPQEKIQYLLEVSGKVNENDTAAQKQLENILKKLYDKYKNDVRTVLLLIDHYTRTQNYALARELLRKVIAKYPEYAMAWRQMLFVCDQEGDQDSVIFYAEKARELFPKDPLYDVYLGYAWLQKKDYEKALKYTEEGIGKVLRRGKDYVDKESGIRYHDLLVQLYGLQGGIYKDLGKDKLSDEAFEKGLKLDPENTLLLNNYSYYLSLRGIKLKKALKMSRKTLEKEPGNPTFLDTYGWILYKMGKIQEAEKYVKEAIEKSEDNSPEVLMHYGDILKKLGELEKAVEYWKMALEKGGDKKEIEKRIKAVKR